MAKSKQTHHKKATKSTKKTQVGSATTRSNKSQIVTNTKQVSNCYQYKTGRHHTIVGLEFDCDCRRGWWVLASSTH